MAEKIVLAHEPPFALGPLTIRPSTRTVLHGDAETVVEPRVMQVLVALARANGTVASRDDLVEQCWEGRIVGDDAINRVLSRLRRLGEETGHAFAIETITRVGYRLVPLAAEHPTAGAPAASIAVAPSPTTSGRRKVDRRGVIALGAATAVTLGGGGLWLGLRRAALPPAARAAMARGEAASSQTTPDQVAVAVAAFRNATELAPDSAETWGRLSLAYRLQLAVSGARDAGEAAQVERRARGAITRALALDPDNADALVARATLVPFYRHWGQMERDCRPLLARFPDHGQLNLVYGIMLADVGRFADALARYRVALERLPEWPQVHMRLMTTLWAMGQIDEADAVMERAFAAWPRHYSVWFSRQRLMTYTGRGTMALAMLADHDTRPIGIPDWNFAMTEAEARAVTTRSAADIAIATRLVSEAAHRAVAFAANAAIFHATLGQLDQAYFMLGAYFFDRGFTIGPQRYSEEQGMYDAHRERETSFLFSRDAAPLRADSRFAPLMREAGFTDYWLRSGTKRDFA